ncbi:MAG: HPP family protein [Sulfobacillus acidophilus]|uniref:HPP family protein n=1 Tax=Sulfobacillus acidophilus TaxID=53633 RepID=A0A2T2WMM3_9FIRM|nr:MAG: HPP family protein [Sulfobacillus acidophilus]
MRNALWWQRYPMRVAWPKVLWAGIMLGLLGALDQWLHVGLIFLVPPFAATLSLLIYLPEKSVAQPIPVVVGSTLASALGTLVAFIAHGPLVAALLALVLLWLLPRWGIYHPPALALAMYPLLLHPGVWFPVIVVLPFTVTAVVSYAGLTRVLSQGPRYPLDGATDQGSC